MIDPADILSTLQRIVARAPSATTEALRAIKAQQMRSAQAARRAALAAEQALADADAAWTPDERAALAALLGGGGLPVRDTYIRIRASKAEKRKVDAAARAAGLTQSDYIRRRLDLPTLDLAADDADPD
jgi:hypothetical protein